MSSVPEVAEGAETGPVTPSVTSVAVKGGRGAVSVVAFSASLNAVQLLSSLVLARKLAPEEYGAFAVGATIVGFARFLGDGGAGSAVIQEPGKSDVDDRDLGRTLALQGAIGLVAAALLIVLSPVIRAAFDAPAALVPLTIGLAIAMLIEVPTVVPRVRLRREQRYQRLQVMAGLSFAALYVVQIGGLLAGLGLWSLVAGQLAYSVVTVSVMLGWGGGIVRPVWNGALALARRGLPYQGALMVQALFSICSVAVVGTQLSTVDLGLWTWCMVLATPLISLAQNLHGVTFPALSRLHEHFPERHSDAVSMVARLQFLFVSAVVGVLCGLTVPLVRFLFDEQWLPAVNAARVALLGVLPLILAALLGAALESSGRPQLRLRAMVISTVVGIAAALPLSALFGVTGAASATFLVVPLLDAVILLLMARADIGRACLDAAFVGGWSLVVGTVAARQVDDLASLVIACVLAGSCALLAVPLVDRASLRTGWTLVRGRPSSA